MDGLFLPASSRLSRDDLIAKLVRANEVFPEREEPLMKYAEQVPLSLMLPARDLARGPGQQHFDRPDTWTGLSDDIAERGILSPIFLEWSTADGYAYAGEGNTRLAVAQELGLQTVPVVVYRKSLPLQGQSRGGEIGPFEFNKRQYLLDQGMNEQMPSWEFKMEDGYVPQYFQPHYLIGFMDQRTAGLRGDLPEGIRFDISRVTEEEADWMPADDYTDPEENIGGWIVSAMLGPTDIGQMIVRPDGVIADVEVNEQYRRMGVATGMLNALREQGVDVQHSDDLTPEGEAWAERTAGRLDLPDKYRDEDDWYAYTPGLSPGQLAAIGPLYHATYTENVPSIMQNGLMPRNMVPAGGRMTDWDESVMPVPGRVYLKKEERPYEVYGPETVLRIDPSKLDPSLFRVDEDLANEFGDDVWSSIEPENGYGTVAYEGTIPPEAISIHRQYDNDGNPL